MTTSSGGKLLSKVRTLVRGRKEKRKPWFRSRPQRFGLEEIEVGIVPAVSASLTNGMLASALRAAAEKAVVSHPADIQARAEGTIDAFGGGPVTEEAGVVHHENGVLHHAGFLVGLLHPVSTTDRTR